MEGLGKLIVTDFVDRNVDYMESVVKQITTNPMGFNAKVRLVHEVLMKGVRFGIDKGEFISKCTSEKIANGKEKSYNKWLTEMIYGINENIEVVMKKNRYKKKK